MQCASFVVGHCLARRARRRWNSLLRLIDGALGSRQAIHALLSNYKKGKKLHLYPSPDEWEVHSPACTLAACVIPSIA